MERNPREIFWNGHGREDSKRKYPRCRTTHLVKTKNSRADIQPRQRAGKYTGGGAKYLANPKKGCTGKRNIQKCRPSEKCVDKGEQMHEYMAPN